MPTPDRTDIFELYARYSCTFDAFDAELYIAIFTEDTHASEVPPAGGLNRPTEAVASACESLKNEP